MSQRYCLNNRLAMYSFLFLSNLLEEKGALLVLDACQRLMNRGRVFRCHFVGGESKELSFACMKDEVKARALQSVISLHGPLYGGDKEKILKNADALVFPTFYHNECFPLVILEAMKHGLPVISTNIAAISDIVVPEETGVLVKPRDVESLVDAMEYFLDNPEKSAELGKNGQLRFRNYFTVQSFESTLCDILREA